MDITTTPTTTTITWGFESRTPSSILTPCSAVLAPASSTLNTLTSFVKAANSLGASPSISYNTVAILGEGATFRVEKASTADRWIAVKRTKLPRQGSESDPTLARRLRSVLLELQVLTYQPLQGHPNIIQLISWAWEDYENGYSPSLLMELAEMGTLSSFLRMSTIGESQKWKFCIGISLGLEALHLHGIAHGDVKLDNVLVSGDASSASYAAKLSDFGSARFCADVPDFSPMSIYAGTPMYSAPEVHQQSASQRIPPKNYPLCDVFSYGLCCFEIFYNGRRYSDAHGAEKFRHILMNGGLAVELPVSEDADPLIKCSKELLQSLPCCREIICKIFEATLATSPAARLAHGWEQIRELGQQNFGITAATSIEGGVCKQLITSPFHKNGFLEAFEELDGEVNDFSLLFNYESLSGVLGGGNVETQILEDHRKALELQSNSSVQIQGKIAFEIAFANAVGFGCSKNNCKKMLFWLKKSAELGYQPALMFGRRAFEANSQAVPGIFPPEPSEASRGVTNDAQTFSQMVRTAWLQSLRDKVLGILGSPFNAPSFFSSRADHIYEVFQKHAYPPEHRFRDGYQQVHILAAMGWKTELEVLINGNPTLMAAKTAKSETPLLLACKAGQLTVVQWLLRNGSDPSLKDGDGLCPLHFLFAFSAEDWEEAALSLLAAGALVGEKPEKRTRLILEPVFLELSGTPSCWAALTRNPPILRFLLAHGAEFDMQFLWIGTQLVCPEILKITVPIVKASGTVIYGASLYGGLGEASRDYMTHSLLTVWTIHGAGTHQAYAHCVDLFRSFGFAEWVPGDPATTPVQWAARRRDLHLLDVLLSRGFKLTSPNTPTFVDNFSTSVFNPIYDIQDEDDILPLLEVLNKHEVLTSPTPRAPTYNLLKYALAYDVRPDIVLPFLLEHGHRVIGTDSWGRTALHYAVSVEAIRPLMEHGAGGYLNVANTEPCNKGYPPCCGIYTHQCFTPVFGAISSGRNRDLVREFLIQGATEVMPGEHFRTVFHEAIILQQNDQDPAKMVSLLLTFEKCLRVINNVDYQGATALQYAVVLGAPELVRILAEAPGASLQTTNYVPLPQELAYHFLKFPPWFVIPGDFPAAVKCPDSVKYNCSRTTCNISVYRKKLLEIKEFLEAKSEASPNIA
ncbi:hypothetical protein FN846DRAFT_904410 [Sphaerosporella brunnea]|uniref:Protein kinase domain-containing protein n=1 Tax=Sphaerosporella brunnea TaxID=1250544 RepID=A0A5J5F538_9PEZI|nr:hypothetical protein FN846DRAFT_904410 [Sphaerosporella brunnea]